MFNASALAPLNVGLVISRSSRSCEQWLRLVHAQDTEQLISRHDLDDYVIASLSLYLDILNLFLKVPPLSFPVVVAMLAALLKGAEFLIHGACLNSLCVRAAPPLVGQQPQLSCEPWLGPGR